MIYDHRLALKVAEYLLEIKAIELNPTNPYTWASGIQSPIYCDNRKILSYPNVRTVVKEAFSTLVKEVFSETTMISGVATAGIAHGALLADHSDLPFSYVRAKTKGHGMQNRIEGAIRGNEKIVVIEDLISTGGSSIAAVDALRKEGCEVLGLLSIFTYGFTRAQQTIEEANCTYYSLTDYITLIQLVEQKGIFSSSEIEYLKDWYRTNSEK